jgi:hypothetical protein
VFSRTARAALFVVAVLWAAPAAAQHVGIAAGANMAEINASGDERLNVLLTDKLELVGGIVLRGDVSDTFSLQAEALYSVKGTRFDVGGVRTDIDLNYLEIPVLVRFGPPADGPAGWLRLFGGPYVARLLGARVRSGSAPSRDLEMNAWDLGWVAGIGAAVGPLQIDFRYGGGFSDLEPEFDDLVPLPTSSSTFRNRGFALLAAYVF